MYKIGKWPIGTNTMKILEGLINFIENLIARKNNI
jgi:hypothetical protein